MKVLLICGGDHKYGSPRSAINLMESIRKIDPSVSFIVLTNNEGRINEYCRTHNIENYVTGHRYAVYKAEKTGLIDYLKRRYRKWQIQSSLNRAMDIIDKKIDMKKIDLVHTNINRDILGQMLAQKYGIPHIMHLREFAKKHYGLSFIFKDQISIMNENTTQFVAISDAVKEDWAETGLDRKKIIRIYNGVRLEPYKHVSNNAVMQIAMVGGIYPEKGQMQLVKAIGLLSVSQRSAIHVDIYGDGKEWYERELSDYVIEHNLQEVISFKGYDPNVSKKLINYDVGILCSKAEGFGLTTVEYMISGLCPIVSDTGANPELVVDEECGLLYRYGDIVDLSNKIKKVIGNRNLIDIYGNAAQIRATNMFMMQKCAENILNLYKRVLKGDGMSGTVQ